MAKILQLDRHVADLIAAGEVVERPASAVKELVENALDAGATQITVEIQSGGMTYIRVTDNGSGMEPQDAETAFLRHATSKLRTKEDLAAIETLGFRGEALAAIAAVSKIDLMTKTPEGEGISLHLEAGVITERSPAGCPDGTTIVVRDLFYNTPARLKFMKRDSVESAQVAGVLQCQALAKPQVSFRLIKDGETVLQTSGNGDAYGAVYQVYGRQLAVDMLPVESRWEQYHLTGFVTKPTATRGNRNYQQFFVNGRPVKSRLLSAALEQAYENRIMTGRFPSCVLSLELPHSAVDVNVHPAKTEIKFASERGAFDCIYHGVLYALSKEQGRPEMKLPQQKKEPLQQPTARPGASAAGKQEGFRTMSVEEYREFAKAISQPLQKPVAPVVAQALTPQTTQGWKTEKKDLTSPRQELPKEEMPKAEPFAAKAPQPKAVEKAPVEQTPPQQEHLPMEQAPAYRVVGEVLDTYFIVEQGEQVLFIDKHAAHERLHFERLRKENAPVMGQLLLTPLTASLTRPETAALLAEQELLETLGYQIEDFGGSDVLIRQIPADLEEQQATATLQALAQDLLEGKKLDPSALRDRMLHTIACKAAIKAGWHTDPMEREVLVRQVMEREDLRYCPHGRPVTVKLTKQQLEKQFKR